MIYHTQEYQYLNLLSEIYNLGSSRMDRTGVGTKALFGRQMRFDLGESFPLITTKEIKWKTAFKEMLWMLSGGRNIQQLLQQDVHIWTDWPYKKYKESTLSTLSQKEFEQKILSDDFFARQWGDLGPVYGHQWRRWKGNNGEEIDQVQRVIDDLKNNPTSRRIIVEGWNVADLDQMALPPCHKTYQFYVDQESNKLSCAMVQRSADAFLGLPWNMANLALLTHLVAKQTGYQVGEAIWFGMDVHLYNNHFKQVEEQLTREPKPLPKIKINDDINSLFEYSIDDIEILDYQYHDAIKGDVAV